jgi:hypothetical protein
MNTEMQVKNIILEIEDDVNKKFGQLTSIDHSNKFDFDGAAEYCDEQGEKYVNKRNLEEQLRYAYWKAISKKFRTLGFIVISMPAPLRR